MSNTLSDRTLAAILRCLPTDKWDGFTIYEIADACSIATSTCRHGLRQLIHRGLVEQDRYSEDPDVYRRRLHA